MIPVINAVLADIGEASPEIFGRTVDLPTVSVDDVPEAAIEKIESALDVQIPSNFGQFTVFDASRLEQVQDAVELFNRLVVFVAILAVALFALTLWVSPRRRRTLIQLVVGIALGVVLLRRLGLRLEDDVVDMVRPENQDAAKVIVGAFVSSLLDATTWVLIIAAVIAVVAVITGPYPWARTARGKVSGRGPLAGRGRPRRGARPGRRSGGGVGRGPPGDRPGRGDRGRHPRAAAGGPVVVVAAGGRPAGRGGGRGRPAPGRECRRRRGGARGRPAAGGYAGGAQPEVIGWVTATTKPSTSPMVAIPSSAIRARR